MADTLKSRSAPAAKTIIRLYRDVEVEAQRSCAKQIAELTRLIRA